VSDLDVPKQSKLYSREHSPPPGTGPAPSHYECPKCHYFVKRIWHRESDGYGHFVYVCLKCGAELT
jgi:hypothetical protein